MGKKSNDRVGGVRVPRAGTRSRRIYDMMTAGASPREIHDALGGSYVSIRVLVWRMKHPDEANRRAQIQKTEKRIEDLHERLSVLKEDAP